MEECGSMTAVRDSPARRNGAWAFCGACFLAGVGAKVGACAWATVTHPGYWRDLPTAGVPAWTWPWTGVDTSEYLHIATAGYATPPGLHAALFPARSLYVFFPGYPAAVHLIGLACPAPVAGLAISLAALLLASVLLFRLVELDYGPSVARWSVIALYCFPSAFVLSDMMSEALFLLFTAGCAYQARRHRWVAAAGLGLAAALTRPIGVLTTLLIARERLAAGPRSRGWWAETMALAATPMAGLGLYAGFNWAATGDAVAFLHGQTAFGRHLSEPLTPLVASTSGDLPSYIAGALALFCLGMLGLAGGQMRRSHLLFALACILTPLMTGTVLSMSRFLVVVWPVPVALGIEARRTAGGRALIAVLAILQLWLLWLRATGHGPVV